MRLDLEFRRYVAQGRYRPPRQWLNYPGHGTTIRPRPIRRARWRLGPRELRILLLALAVGALAWWTLDRTVPRSGEPVAAARAAR